MTNLKPVFLRSLRAGADRLAVSVIWTLRPDLQPRAAWFGRTVIQCGPELGLGSSLVLWLRSTLHANGAIGMPAAYACDGSIHT